MTPTGGGPALPGAGTAALADGHAPASHTTRARQVRLRTVLSLARAEASLLACRLLVLAGLIAGGAVVWVLIATMQPLWWSAGWRIGAGQLILGMTVLAAAQLTAGRVRRDAMTDLYASFPATAGTRTLGYLAGLVGAVPASLVLLGAGAVVVQARGAVGSPSITVLVAGVVLVVAAGAVGVAIGTRFAHPLAGVIGALLLFLPEATSHLSSGAGLWLVPWDILQNQLGNLPGPLAGYPPAAAHALELAGGAVLAGVVALAMTVRGTRARGGVAAAGVVAVAVIAVAAVVQLSPLPTPELNHLAAEIADPGSVQHCTTAKSVRYCLYPGFGRDLPSLEAPVDGVLAELPARPGQALTVGQIVAPQDINNEDLFYGHSQQQVTRWDAQIMREPANAPSASAFYLPVGRWPASGGRLADAHFNVALTAAEWAVRLLSPDTLPTQQPCVPVDQAREPIAIWLAIAATHPPASSLQNDGGMTAVQVHNTAVPTWTNAGGPVGQVSGSEPQLTEAGSLLAKAMTNLPEQKVSQVLRGAWATWLNEHTTDGQLAAALGLRVPTVPPPPSAGSGARQPGSKTGGQPGSQSPVCTS
jgi:hypothetical protein